MTDDFEIYQGTNITPYFVVVDSNGAPVDVTSWTAATWIAATVSGEVVTPVIVKHKDDMDVGLDPLNEAATVDNCVFVPILPADTEYMADVGQFRHELRLDLAEQGEVVIYPPVGHGLATFSVIQSISWNATVTPPAPRLVAPQAPQPKEVEKPEEVKNPYHDYYSKKRR